jgi:hypothetical protein
LHPTLVGLTRSSTPTVEMNRSSRGATQAAKDLSAEAELVLHLSAALIVYLVKKRIQPSSPSSCFPQGAAPLKPAIAAHLLLYLDSRQFQQYCR